MSPTLRSVGLRCGLVVGSALFLAAPPLALPAVDPASTTVPVHDELQEVAERFGQALGQGNAETLARLFSESGIRLRLEGLDRSALSARQAHAALRDFLRSYQPGQVRLVRAAPVEGNSGRGFAQLHWETRVVGTSHPVVHAIFLGLVREGESWRVDEFRLLP